jgi:hypothetical protein
MSSRPLRTGVFPGSFDPPTVAHLHLAEVAREQCGLERVELSLSHAALGKSVATMGPIDERVAAIERLARTRTWLGVRVTEAQLLVDVAEGYDVVVMGADKWNQLLDPAWYPSEDEHRVALGRLPLVAVAPRADLTLGVAPAGVEMVVLEVDDRHRHVSATAVRAGRAEWLAAGG